MFVLRTVRKVECCPPPVLGVRGPLGSNLGGVRTTIQKHWNPNFKKLRRQKVLKIDLPDYQQLERPVMEIPKEEIRSRMKERGIVPSRYWPERPFYIASTSQIFEPYVPPEGDGKVSVISSQGAKQKLEFVEKKGKSMLALRKIRNYDEEFDSKVFAKEAQEVYIQAHKAMTNKERDKLHQFVTERAYPEIVSNVGDKTLIWQFLQSIEPPRVVHLRCTDVITKENIYAQVTVRFHTQQIMAVYDRFGRLMHGNETIPKDVLEYVVFEKHLASQYGRWRVHDKIIPDWMPPREPSKKTYCETAEEEEEAAALPAQQQTSAPATV